MLKAHKLVIKLLYIHKGGEKKYNNTNTKHENFIYPLEGP